MPRQARKNSPINIYTVVLRGKTECFKDDALKNLFLCCTFKYTDTNQAKLLAYAISKKDCYLVVKEGEGTLSDFVRKSSSLFARQYNKNYPHMGKVFQDRYLSEPLDNESQVLDAIKQVCLMDQTNKDYFTSLDHYFEDMFLDSTFVRERFTESEWKTHLKTPSKQKTYKISIGKLTDKQISDYILQKYNIKVTKINKLNKNVITQILTDVYEVTRVSARQLGRITSLPLRFLWGILGNKKKENDKND